LFIILLMNIDTIKNEFFKQTNALLSQLTSIDNSITQFVDNLTLDETHIEIVNNNISPYIQHIIIFDFSVFNNNDIIFINDNINLSTLFKSINDDTQKTNICKYLQTIYLISNTYNKENIDSQTKKFMKQIKSTLTNTANNNTTNNTTIENNTIENNTTENNTTENNTNDNKFSKNVDEACEKLTKTFGNNDFMKNIMDMTKKIVNDPNINLTKLMSQDPDEINKIISKSGSLFENGNIDLQSLNNDAMQFVSNLMGDPAKPNKKNKSLKKSKKSKKK